MANTCKDNCVLSSPESFGDKDFGFNSNDSYKYTNSHGIHAYENLRAGAAGQSSQTGCYEFIPGLSKQQTVCGMDFNPSYTTVGDWNKLKENKNITASNTSWNKFYDNNVPPSSGPPSSNEY